MSRRVTPRRPYRDRVHPRQPSGGPRSPWPPLAVAALAYAVLQHGGTLFTPLGAVGTSATRWADWLDLLTPYAVLLPALAALRAAGSDRLGWGLAAVGAVLYTQGHGIHLAANSIGNAAPGEPAHLWDEVVGHWLWYAGFALVAAAVVRALDDRPVPRPVLGAATAVAVGLTWATNALEGGTAPGSLAVAGLALVAGARGRGAARLLVWAAVPAVAVVVAWGAWQGGFPQPSAVGWP